jgi:COP9 signalosome complex subunit 1
LQASTLAAAKEYEREARRRIQHMNIQGAELGIQTSKLRHGTGIQPMDIGDFEGGGRELRSGRVNF